MSMVVYNNLSSMRILGEVGKNSTSLSKSIKKVSTGMKINSAGDGASEWSISEGMKAQIRALDQDNANTQTAQSLLRVAEGAVASTIEIMRTLKEKAINAANDTNTNADRAIIQKEINQQVDQINDNANVTFNGKYIFDGAADHTYSTEQAIVAALHTEWISNSLDIIEQSTGLNFANSSGVKEIGVYFSQEATNTLAYVTNWSDSRGKVSELALTINMKYYSDMDKDDANGKALGGYLDRTIAHELTHAVMASNIEGFRELYGCIKEGAAEVIHGVDDTRRSAILDFAQSGTSIKSNLEKISGTGDIVKHYAGGYTMFRFMAAQSGYEPTDMLTHFMGALASGSGHMTDARVDQAVSDATKGKYRSFDAMVDAMAAARDNCTDTKEFLLKYCDINLENDKIDVGAISGSDAGSKESKNAESTVPEGGSTKYWTNPTERATNIDGLIVKWQEGAREVDFGGGDVRQWDSATIQLKGGLYFQVGTKANQSIHAIFSNIDAQALGLMDKERKVISVSTQVAAERAITQLDKSIKRALDQQTRIGSWHDRMDYTSANLTTASENVTAADSVIRDADMAKEMAAYTKNSVLLQAAQSMLAQANQNSNSVLSLLQ